MGYYIKIDYINFTRYTPECMGCSLIYDLKLQFIFLNFSVFSLEYYFIALFLIILNKT